jgi:hypothetical protein
MAWLVAQRMFDLESVTDRTTRIQRILTLIPALMKSISLLNVFWMVRSLTEILDRTTALDKLDIDGLSCLDTASSHLRMIQDFFDTDIVEVPVRGVCLRMDWWT